VTAVALQVELALEGVVDRLDQLPQRPKQSCASPLGLARAGRSQQPHARLGQDVLDLAAVVVLVGHQQLPGRTATRCGWTAGRSSGASRSAALAPADATATGRAVPGADQVQPQPQNRRAGLAPRPEQAHPASAEPLSVWLERPPSTGVASTIHPSSLPRAVSVAMAPMAWPMSPATRRRRRWQSP
jgi:hypothetical protein